MRTASSTARTDSHPPATASPGFGPVSGLACPDELGLPAASAAVTRYPEGYRRTHPHTLTVAGAAQVAALLRFLFPV